MDGRGLGLPWRIFVISIKYKFSISFYWGSVTRQSCGTPARFLRWRARSTHCGHHAYRSTTALMTPSCSSALPATYVGTFVESVWFLCAAASKSVCVVLGVVTLASKTHTKYVLLVVVVVVSARLVIAKNPVRGGSKTGSNICAVENTSGKTSNTCTWYKTTHMITEVRTWYTSDRK